MLPTPHQHMTHAKCSHLCADLSRQISTRDGEMFIILHCDVSSTSGMVPEQVIAHVKDEQSSVGHEPADSIILFKASLLDEWSL